MSAAARAADVAVLVEAIAAAAERTAPVNGEAARHLVAYATVVLECDPAVVNAWKRQEWGWAHARAASVAIEAVRACR